MSLTEIIRENLTKYYKTQNREYEDGFAEWCDGNGYDTDDIERELWLDDIHEMMIIEFVEDDFPYPPGTPDDQDGKNRKIVEILRHSTKKDANFDGYCGYMPYCMSQLISIFVDTCLCYPNDTQSVRRHLTKLR